MTEQKSITLSEDVALKIKEKRKHGEFNLSAWIDSKFREEFMHDD